MDLSHKLPRSFYDRDTTLVARELLGALLVHCVEGVERVGRIVEVEAYLGPHDLAAHSARGLTPRTRLLFGPPGYAYVYLVYGLHWCMNIVTEREGHGAAVLLRAIEPVQNLSEPGIDAGEIVCRPRIGVAYSGVWAERLLRFYIRGNPFVSRA
jgi:DNA-3-methyladenine glycosylase